jgi:hypothetical protein
LALTCSAIAQAAALPHGVTEVVKLYRGGINKDLIINYINSTALPCHLGVDGIIYLQSLGMPPEITKAIIERDGKLRQLQTIHQYHQPQAMPGAVYNYDYPAYSYGAPYIYWPPVLVGGWWGWGHGGLFCRPFGGFRGGMRRR